MRFIHTTLVVTLVDAPFLGKVKENIRVLWTILSDQQLAANDHPRLPLAAIGMAWPPSPELDFR